MRKKIDMSIINEETLKHLKASPELINWFVKYIGKLPVEKLKDIKGDYKGHIKWLKRHYGCPEKGYIVKYNEYGQLLYYKYSDDSWGKFEYDEDGNLIYCEESDGFYSRKVKFNKNGRKIYYEESAKDYWMIKKYDENGNEIYFKKSNGYWEEKKHNENGILTYYRDSIGRVNQYEFIKKEDYFIIKCNDCVELEMPLK